jgi:hypothetical protein
LISGIEPLDELVEVGQMAQLDREEEPLGANRRAR